MSGEILPDFFIKCQLINRLFICSETVFVFPCDEGHVTCLDCFRQYATTRLRERQFWQHPDYGYTLACPIGCSNSFIKEIHHFRLLSDNLVSTSVSFNSAHFVFLVIPFKICKLSIIPLLFSSSVYKYCFPVQSVSDLCHGGVCIKVWWRSLSATGLWNGHFGRWGLQ